MKTLIAALLTQTLKDMGITGVVPQVDVPEDPARGDYTTNVAMILAKSFKNPPMDIALSVKESIDHQLLAISQTESDQNIVKHGQTQSKKLSQEEILQAIDRIEVIPPGFINLFLTEASLITEMQRLLESAESRGTAHATKFRILVEFAHPNTHKAFHIGHLRNITTGESIIRLLESQGNEVIRANYQGDVGMHIAKALYSLMKLTAFSSELSDVGKKEIHRKVEFLGKAYAAGSKAFEEDAVAKEEIVSLNALIYASAQRFARKRGIDPGTTDYLALVNPDYRRLLDEVYELWKETRQWSLDYFETIYKRVGSHYDRYYFESECLAGVDLARQAVKKGVLREDAGAVILDGKPYGIDTRVFINSKGLPTYEGKELKLASMETTEHGDLDRLIHVVGPEQASFFQVTFKAEELLGIVKPGMQHHLIYGWVKLKHGKMSSRSGNVVLGEWLLDEAKKAIYGILDKTQSKYTKKQQEEIAEKAAVAAVKYAFLKVGTTSEIAFDMETSVSFDGDSGPYLQYTYARCKSVLRKADIPPNHPNSPNYPNLNPEERVVLRLLAFFPDIVKEAADGLSPGTLCTYLYKLAAAYNLFYAKHAILPSSFRLFLTAATSQVLKNGLYLLGIETLEQM